MSEPTIEPLFDAETIRERVTALGARLDGDATLTDPLVIGLLGGSVVFLADLIRAVRGPLRYEFIHVQYDAAPEEVLAIHYPLPLQLAEQRVLVVKDVVSTGVIESYLANQLRQHGAADIRFAALLDIPAERKTNLVVDYSLFTLERNGIFVGYGLKHDGRHGNLPYIGRLQESA